ncbi:MAG: FAD:protein FMN transferase [Gemmataceae bacterium]
MRGSTTVCGLLLVVIGAAPGGDPALARFEFAETQMATRFRVVLYAPDKAAADKAAKAAFLRAAELNGIMSDYQPASELMRLCAKGGGDAVPVSPDLFAILERSQHFAKLTDGAFDITIGPVVRLWRRTRRTKVLPESAALAAARELVGYEKLTLDPVAKTAKLAKPGMQLDLGGIAKGYAAEAMQKVLRDHGVTRALVAAGGDIVVSDPPPGTKGWRVGVTPLGEEEKGAPTLLLANAAVSTSGDAEQAVEIDGKRYAHIVDPKTGLGLGERFQVTVVAKDGTTSDALATGLSVMGSERSIKLIETIDGVSARFVWKGERGLEVRTSRGFPQSQ